MFYTMKPYKQEDFFQPIDICIRKNGYKYLISAIKAAKKHSGYVKDSKNKIVWLNGKLFTDYK